MTSALVLVMLLLACLLWGRSLYLRYLQRQAQRLRQQGDLAQAVRLERRQQWLGRWNQDRAILFLSGSQRQVDEAKYEGGDAGRVVQMAEQLRDSGGLDEAQRLIEEALAQARACSLDWTKGYAVLLRTLASIHQKRGAVATARPLLEQALAIQRRAAQETRAPAAPVKRPRMVLTPAGLNRAIEYALDLNRLQIGDVLASLGAVYQALGDYPAAVRAYEEALTVYRQRPEETRVQTGSVLHNLGTLYLEMRDLDRAGDVLGRAAEHLLATHGDRHPAYATALLNLAIWHEKKREFAEAFRLIRESVDIRAEVFGEASPEYLHGLNNLANTLRQAGHYRAARPLVERVLAGRAACGEDHPLNAFALVSRAVLEVIDGRPAEALALYREVFAVEQSTIGRIFSVASDAQRLAYLDKSRQRLSEFLSLVRTHLSQDPAAVAAAYDVVLTRKALTAEAAAARRDAALGGRHPELAEKLRELTALRQQAAARALAGPGPEGADAHRQLLAQWQERQAALELELAAAVPEVALEQRLRAADRKAVAAALPAGSALVEFVRFDLCDFRAVPARGEEQWQPARYLAFVLRPEAPDAVTMVDLGEAGPIDRLVWAFRADVLGGGAGPSRGMALLDDDRPAASETAPGAVLRRRVFDPLPAAVAGAGHLVLAPDGELALVPFEVLPGDDGRPLLEDYAFSYLAVGRDALRSEAGHGQGGRSLVLAAPDFDLGSATVGQVSNLPSQGKLETCPTGERPQAAGLSRDLGRPAQGFAPLPGTREEGCEVAGLLGVEPVLGPDAVEARVKAAVAPRVLHLATHGFFLPDQATDPDGGFCGAAPENPLVRSGLAMAGANTWLAGGTPPAEAEDGLLTAEDVTGLDLLGTELVVLSACETGLGEVRAGEGVFGLRRAFQLAGARAVVMSLWKVPDGPTRELMGRFYRHLRAGLSRTEALRRAQLELRTQYPHPRDWGAFIIQGDPGPLGAASEQSEVSVPVTKRAGDTAVPSTLERLNSDACRPGSGDRRKPGRRVVYDVLDDVSIRAEDRMRLAGAVCLYLLCLIGSGLVPSLCFSGQPGWSSLPHVLGMLITVSILYWIIAGLFLLFWAWDQRWCRRCRRVGAFTTTEGTVSGCQHVLGQGKSTSDRELTFHVGDQCFTVRSSTWQGGFRLGELRGVPHWREFIHDGARLRILHRADRILGIEVLDPAAEAPEPVTVPPDNLPARVKKDPGIGHEVLQLWIVSIVFCFCFGLVLLVGAWVGWTGWNGNDLYSLRVVRLMFAAGACLLLSGGVLLRDLIRLYREEPARHRVAAWFVRGGLYAGTLGLFVWWLTAVSAPPVGIGCLAFSPDGSRLAVGCADARVRLFDAARLESNRQTSLVLPGPVTGMAWSPDGERLVVACHPELDPAVDCVAVVDVVSGQVLHQWPAKWASRSGALACSASRDLVAWRDDTAVVVADATTGSILRTLAQKAGPQLAAETVGDNVERRSTDAYPAALAFSPDGGRLAVGSSAGPVAIWDIATWQERVVLTEPAEAVTCLAWSPDGTRLVGGGASGQAVKEKGLYLWDAGTGKRLAIIRIAVHLWNGGVAFSPDGERLATASDGDRVIIWDGRTGERKSDLTSCARVEYPTGVAWSPAGHLAVAPTKGPVVLLDPSSGARLRRFYMLDDQP